jgi:hypothetical protein
MRQHDAWIDRNITATERAREALPHEPGRARPRRRHPRGHQLLRRSALASERFLRHEPLRRADECVLGVPTGE